MKSKIFIIMLGLVIISGLKAQDINGSDDFRKRTLNFSTGYFNYASIDKLFADQIYSGGGPFLGISIGKQKKFFRQTAFRFASFSRTPKNMVLHEYIVDSDSHLARINHLHLEVDALYLFPIRKYSTEYITLSFLVNWFTSIDLTMNNNMMPEQLLSSIAPGLHVEYSREKHRLEGRLSTALISYTCRANYSNVIQQDYEKLNIPKFIKTNSRVQFPGSLQNLLAGINYEYDFSDRTQGTVYYHFRYLHNSKPRPLSVVTGIYGFGITFNF
jgi:hypothetical protein